MNFFSRFPVIVSFLLIALLTSVSISLYTYTNIFNKEIEVTINSELRRINQRMNELQGTFNDFNKRQNPNAIHREVSRLSGDKTMQVVAIIDEHKLIMYSSLIEYRNTPLAEVPDINSFISTHARLRSSGIINITDNQKHIIGLYPVDAISHPDKRTSFQHAYLYARFDLSQTLQTLKFKQQEAITQISLFHFIFLVVSFLLLYASMRNRIQSIVHAINEFSKGHYNSRIDLTGRDEFTRIAAGFNTMASQVSSQNRQLKEQEQDLSVTLNSIGNAVIATDSDGLVTRMNPVAQALTGWELDSAIGTSIQSILIMKNASTLEPIEYPFEQVVTTGETVSLHAHTILISKNGAQYYISDSASPIKDITNNIIGMVIIFNDVTEQYHLRQAASKSERLLTSIMNNTPAVIYVKDVNGKFTYINKVFESLFNITKEQAIGKSLFDIFPESIANEMHKNDQVVMTSSSILQIEETAQHKDGMHTYATVKFPLFDDNGNVDAVCGISTDITLRKKQEQHFNQSQKMESLGKLTGGIAHDYNNMLSIILGYCELLKLELSANEKLFDYTNEIYHACERGTQLSKKLLSFSRINQDNAVSLNINDLLTERADMLEKMLTKRIKLTFYLYPNLWPVNLNAGDLEDAIINISINAMHAMENAGELTITTSNVSLSEIEASQSQLKAGDYVLFCITDTGIGMNKETQNKMFDPFYTSKGSKGTGLGLSQVYGFVQSSKGVIKVYSEPDIGTRLSIYFPRDTHATNSGDTPPEALSESLTDLNGHETILVVDDEKALREFVNQLLSEKGYKVLLAEDGENALEILKNEHVDLLFSDVIMPGINGYQLATKTLELYPDIKIQLASGFTDKHHTDMANTSLHNNLLYKPFKAVDLLTRIRELLNNDKTK